jgi:putative ABC transport system permease protein
MAIGIGIGLVIAVAATRVMRSVLFDVAPTDLMTYVGVSAILLIAALVASYLPARRAARIHPMEALRHE